MRIPASILYNTADRYRPVSYPDGPITARYRFIKNAYWDNGVGHAWRRKPEYPRKTTDHGWATTTLSHANVGNRTWPAVVTSERHTFALSSPPLPPFTHTSTHTHTHTHTHTNAEASLPDSIRYILKRIRKYTHFKNGAHLSL